MRFALAYSCGKDSTLALRKMIQAGHDPVCLIAMVRKDQDRSWFHGADEAMLAACEKALAIPLMRCRANGDEYAQVFELALARARELGAKACAFGDIDLEENRLWEEARCKAAGLECQFPLWQLPRAEILSQILSEGFKCLIKTLNFENFPALRPQNRSELCERFLGRFLDEEFVAELERLGLDACGENGEYHTLVVDGPVFRQPLSFKTGKILDMGGHATIEVEFRP